MAQIIPKPSGQVVALLSHEEALLLAALRGHVTDSTGTVHGKLLHRLLDDLATATGVHTASAPSDAALARLDLAMAGSVDIIPARREA